MTNKMCYCSFVPPELHLRSSWWTFHHHGHHWSCTSCRLSLAHTCWEPSVLALRALSQITRLIFEALPCNRSCRNTRLPVFIWNSNTFAIVDYTEEFHLRRHAKDATKSRYHGIINHFYWNKSNPEKYKSVGSHWHHGYLVFLIVRFCS